MIDMTDEELIDRMCHGAGVHEQEGADTEAVEQAAGALRLAELVRVLAERDATIARVRYEIHAVIDDSVAADCDAVFDDNETARVVAHRFRAALEAPSPRVGA